MYQWYSSAAICYAYLGDVMDHEDIDPEYRFWNSRWFMRGWTLQELIAPPEVVFFTQGWNPIGTRTTLSSKISEITRIDNRVLKDKTHVRYQSTAQRMAWASRRSTTRPEDEAYCLMGIFNVNMPLLYGEGKKAFLRLQEEILKRSSDHTLFAWTFKNVDDIDGLRTDIIGGLLAESPSDFEGSGNYVRHENLQTEWKPYSMTNMGLCINLPVFQEDEDEAGTWIAILDCHAKSEGYKRRMGITLRMAAQQKQAEHSNYYKSHSTVGIRLVTRSPKSFLITSKNLNDTLTVLSDSGKVLTARWATIYVAQIRNSKNIPFKTGPNQNEISEKDLVLEKELLMLEKAALRTYDQAG